MTHPSLGPGGRKFESCRPDCKNLIEWQQSNEKAKGEINEDAIFSIAVPMPDRIGKIRYYFEYDTRTEPLWQIAEKFTRYITLKCESNGPYHVLFACSEEDRVRTLAKHSRKFVGGEKSKDFKFFLFTTLESILTDTQGAICCISYDETKYPLAPDLL